jgi:hypothetical protein
MRVFTEARLMAYNDDIETEDPSFLRSAGSFLWNALKIVAITVAVGALIMSGLALTSDKVANWIDSKTANAEKGTKGWATKSREALGLPPAADPNPTVREQVEQVASEAGGALVQGTIIAGAGAYAINKTAPLVVKGAQTGVGLAQGFWNMTNSAGDKLINGVRWMAGKAPAGGAYALEGEAAKSAGKTAAYRAGALTRALPGALASGGAALAPAALPAGIVVASGLAVTGGVMAGKRIYDTASAYSAIDDAFQPNLEPNLRQHAHLITAQQMFGRTLENFGGEKDANGKFPLSNEKNVTALTKAIDDKKSQLQETISENSRWYDSRYIQWTQASIDMRNAKETARIEIASLDAALEELKDYQSTAMAKAQEIKKQKTAQAQAKDVKLGEVGIAPLNGVVAPQTPAVVADAKNKNAQPTGDLAQKSNDTSIF